MSPSAQNLKISACVASKTSSRSTRRPARSEMSKKRRQLISSAAVRHQARR
jgi:hypothetical protein